MEKQAFPFDLHVLGMPPALILSQDQTLQKKFIFVCFKPFAQFLIRIVLFVLTLRLFRHI